MSQIDAAIDYIANTPVIRDVLLSGGDPLLLSDDRLEYIIKRLRAIPHVEIVRIGSRTPVVMPQRITDDLVNMLKKYHPIWLNTHFNHPNEITPDSTAACERLANAGIPLGNQSVLLRGVNDCVHVMKKLVQDLVRIRVRPYYIYQCKSQIYEPDLLVVMDESLAGIDDLAAGLKEGGKVVMNTPKRPLEASGTSGMKAAHNGVPSLSVLDGWWLEGHVEAVTGWSIGGVGSDAAAEAADTADLYAKLEVILPLYHRDRPRWISVMKGAIALNASYFNTHRMVQQYVANAYL
jgi:hypothetical protein